MLDRFISNKNFPSIYAEFLEKAMKFIRAVNTYIVDGGVKLNKASSEYYALMSEELTDDLLAETDFQVISFCYFSNSKDVKKKFEKNPEAFPDQVLVEIIVPQGCFNGCPLKKGSWFSFWEKTVVLIPPYSVFQVLERDDRYIRVQVVEDNREYIESQDQ
mmetsp:Transcript_13139/g.15200  ORF Transcript_13139/g.15200 Transcript_13139/m.15200 type:complete len:160 (-) Transcript_13139:49-528(-)